MVYLINSSNWREERKKDWQISGQKSNLFYSSHRITECSGLEGTSVGHPVQPSCRGRVTYSRLNRTLSRWGLNISREGDSTASLGSLFQGSVTLRVKKLFLVFRRNFLCFRKFPFSQTRLLLPAAPVGLPPSHTRSKHISHRAVGCQAAVNVLLLKSMLGLQFLTRVHRKMQ